MSKAEDEADNDVATLMGCSMFPATAGVLWVFAAQWFPPWLVWIVWLSGVGTLTVQLLGVLALAFVLFSSDDDPVVPGGAFGCLWSVGSVLWGVLYWGLFVTGVDPTVGWIGAATFVLAWILWILVILFKG